MEEIQTVRITKTHDVVNLIIESTTGKESIYRMTSNDAQRVATQLIEAAESTVTGSKPGPLL